MILKPFLSRCTRWALCGLAFLNLQTAEAQRNYDLHWVAFHSKKGTPYSIWQPQAYLSARSLARRQQHNIPIDSTDLPVNPAYLKAVAARGFEVRYPSRWLNGAIVIGKMDSLERLKTELPFVKEVRSIGFARMPEKPLPLDVREVRDDYRKRPDFYGEGSNQIKMLNGQYLHRMGFRGEGLQVAVFDAGFVDYRETPAFDSLEARHQILGTRDFLQNDEFVYEGSDHGRDVLSTMGANLPYLFVGTSPDASFYLIKTEDEAGEYVSEEFVWLAAAEYADSIGVDVINSSLGYYDFDDKKMNYGYVDFDGNTTVIAQSADLAARKGILVVTSAGNTGNDKWKYLTTPADADSVLTVGAVDRDGNYAIFSAKGFSSQNAKGIKPNVAARGQQSIVAMKGKYDTRYNSGTSFSAPIIAGIAAALWQSAPQASNMDIIRALEIAGSESDRPDNLVGYGIPDVLNAYNLLNQSLIEIKNDKITYPPVRKLFPHRVDILITDTNIEQASVQLLDPVGALVWEAQQKSNRNEPIYFNVPDWATLPAGVYNLYVRLGKTTKRYLLVK